MESGKPPSGAEVEIGYEDSEYGRYPVIVVLWDNYETEYPQDYIERCMEAFARFAISIRALSRISWAITFFSPSTMPLW